MAQQNVHDTPTTRRTDSGASRVVIGSAVAAAVALIAGISIYFITKGDKDEAAPATTTTIVPTLSHLTGLPLANVDLQDRPVLSLKIDNSPVARPQGQLDQTDVIVEERVEGGLSRFIAIFQSKSPDKVGPIRSVRSTDAAIVDAFGGLFGYSGGIPAFVAKLHTTSVKDVGFDAVPSAYFRRHDLGRSFEHTLYTDTNDLRKSSKADGATGPQDFFTFLVKGQPFKPIGSKVVSGMSVSLGHVGIDFTWGRVKRQWLRSTDGSPHFTETPSGPVRLSATNVIVQYVSYQGTGQKDPAGNPVDEAVTIGNGTGVAFANGRSVPVKWSKPASNQMTQYTLNDGTALNLVPGRTWVILAPTSAHVVTRP